MTHEQGVVLVTGGTRGIGFGISQVLASKGYNLILGYNANRKAALHSQQVLRRKHPSIQVEIVGADTFNMDQTIGLYLNVVKSSFDNKLIGVVHNAGGYPGLSTKSVHNKNISPVYPGDIKSDEQFMWIDYYYKIYGLMWMKLLERCAPLMDWRKDIGGGRFVFISAPGNNLSQNPQPGYVAPGTGKAVGEYLVRQYAKVYASRHITVNCIIPGIVKTDAWVSYKDENLDEGDVTDVEQLANFKQFIQITPMQRFAQPTEVGELAAYLVSDQALFLTGVSIPFDGGFHLGPNAISYHNSKL